jgi:hypothetical protein
VIPPAAEERSHARQPAVGVQSGHHLLVELHADLVPDAPGDAAGVGRPSTSVIAGRMERM